MDAVVKKVYENSIADEIGMEPGDIIVSIDGQKLKDILDFKFLSSSDEYELEILKKDGTTEIIELVNEGRNTKCFYNNYPLSIFHFPFLRY